MKKIGVLYHPLKPAAQALARELQEFLSLKGVSVWLGSAWEEDRAKSLMDGTDLLLSIGGDGTILRAAKVALNGQTPIVGINQGNLGFLTEFTADNAKTGLIALLENKGWVDERTMLEAELQSPGESAKTFYALNDVVVARGAIARLVVLEVKVNSEPMTNYRADGLIAATATGSTGYSLAAGGPILHPQAKELLLTPILSHLSPAYSLILPSIATISICIRTTVPGTLSIDGHINLTIAGNSVITVKHSSKVTRFLGLSPPDAFYSSLEQKLKGKPKE